MVDYSKFDHIEDSDSDHEEENPPRPARPIEASAEKPASSLNADSKPPPQAMTKKGKEGRLKFEYDGRTIYEWEQSLSEVNIYIEPPPGLPSKLIDISITHNHLKVGMKDTAPFIDEDTGGPIKPDESMWTLIDGELNINLQKMNKAEAWDCALRGQAGQAIDDFTKEETKKKLLLERFQEEHPGFDFSGADFNGQVPDAREFMGGVKHF